MKWISILRSFFNYSLWYCAHITKMSDFIYNKKWWSIKWQIVEIQLCSSISFNSESVYFSWKNPWRSFTFDRWRNSSSSLGSSIFLARSIVTLKDLKCVLLWVLEQSLQKNFKHGHINFKSAYGVSFTYFVHKIMSKSCNIVPISRFHYSRRIEQRKHF